MRRITTFFVLALVFASLGVARLAADSYTSQISFCINTVSHQNSSYGGTIRFSGSLGSSNWDYSTNPPCITGAVDRVETWIYDTSFICTQGTYNSQLNSCVAEGFPLARSAVQKNRMCSLWQGGQNSWFVYNNNWTYGGPWDANGAPVQPWLIDLDAGACDACYEIYTDDCNPSPIVIPLGPSAAIKLTSAHDGVAFDIRANGHADQVAWTEADTNTAFLAYDKNGNGSIDDGSELFGDHTVPGVREGFGALRKLSGETTPNLTAANPFFAKLLLWVDRNHNGTSERGELLKFGDYFASIGLGAEMIDRKDQHGNAFRLLGHAQRRTAPGPNITWDRAERAKRNVVVYDVYLTVEK